MWQPCRSRRRGIDVRTNGHRKKRANDIRRPFDPKLLARARRIAATYQVVMWTEDGEYFGRGVELPMTFGDGPTADECMQKTREALTVTVAYMIEQGEAPPAPASEASSTEEISLRVTAEEKLRLETLAAQRGFKGVADYLRAQGLSRAG
jgi:predicted RNase H-like HicB family nuclease